MADANNAAMDYLARLARAFRVPGPPRAGSRINNRDWRSMLIATNARAKNAFATAAATRRRARRRSLQGEH